MRTRKSQGMTVTEAGRKGGLRTSDTHGHDFYVDIGRKGGSKGGPRVKNLIEAGKKSLGQKTK
ncbi:MAG TPA: Em GEA1 (EM1) [Armatimonadota bacterium]